MKLVKTDLLVRWLKKLHREQKSWSLTLASTYSARMPGWMAWNRNALQNALLDESRVLNPKCPMNFTWKGGQKQESLAS